MLFCKDAEWRHSKRGQCAYLRGLTGRQGMRCPARVLRSEHGITLPARVAQEFCALVGKAGEHAKRKPGQQAIWSLFCNEYLAEENYYEYVAHDVFGIEGRGPVQVALKIRYGGQGALLRAEGSNLIHATISALGWSLEVLPRDMLLERLSASARTIAFAEILVQRRATLFGIGVSEHRTAAMIVAVLSAVNRALRRGLLDDAMKTAATQDSTSPTFPCRLNAHSETV